MPKKNNVSLSILELCSINTDLAKEKLRISPIGRVTGIDGRVFDIDGQAVLERLINTGLELVLNIGHAHEGEAAGWFTQFELRDDGIYAQLALNENGEELLEKKKYKYLSPEYLVNYDTNDVMHVIGVGLVNQPNLLNEALNNIDASAPLEGNMTTEEQEALAAENKALKEQIATLTASQNSLEKEQRQVKIDNAIGAGKLAPSKRDFALTLEANALDGYLELEAKTFTKTDDNGINPNQQDNDLDDADCEVFAQLGLNQDDK